MKTIYLLLLTVGLIWVLSNNSFAAWCITVEDEECGDTDWGRIDYTIPQDANVITIRYDTGSPDCCVDIEIWAVENNPPTLEGQWLEKCNCGVVTFNEPWNAGHILQLAVKCYINPDYTGPGNPCAELTPNARFYWPSNNLNCNTQCIPD